MRKIAIVGSRGYPRLDLVDYWVLRLQGRNAELTIISGGARGVDRRAAAVARANGIPVIEHLPDWSQGRGAALARNTTIVTEAETVLAFWDGQSRGTKDSIDKARALDREVLVFGPDGEHRRDLSWSGKDGIG